MPKHIISLPILPILPVTLSHMDVLGRINFLAHGLPGLFSGLGAINPHISLHPLFIIPLIAVLHPTTHSPLLIDHIHSADQHLCHCRTCPPSLLLHHIPLIMVILHHILLAILILIWVYQWGYQILSLPQRLLVMNLIRKQEPIR